MAWHDQPKLREHPDVEAYLEALEPRQRELVEAMRELVRGMDEGVVECLAWGVPFWFKDGPLCYASAAKRHVTIGMARGVEIDDPSGQLTGTGKSPIRKCTVRLGATLPAETPDWVEQALALDSPGE